MKMPGLSGKQLAEILIKNGWHKVHRKSSHVTYHKEGTDKIITIVDNKKEMCRPMARRLLKEAGIL